MRQSSLGKGLSALLKEELIVASPTDTLQNIDIDNIIPGEYQPRKNFEYEKIKELADSILINGLIQPIVVSKIDNGKFKIIAGERRWRACKLANYSEIPVIIKDLSNQKILEIALIENIQREELSAIEEAEGYLRLIKEFNYTQEQLSEMLGKSRSHIANLLRLNQLPQEVKEMINNNKLSMGHARCLVGNEQAIIIAQYIIDNDLSVRQTENVIKEWKKIDDKSTEDKDIVKEEKVVQGPIAVDKELIDLATSLSEKFNTIVTIEEEEEGKGKLIFNYSSLEELDKILELID